MAKIPRITDQPRPVAPPRLLWRPGVRSIGTPQPLKLPLTQSPRLNATEAGVKPIRVYRIVSPSGERLIDAATLGSLLNYNQVFRARDGRTGGEYYVQRELIEQKGSAALEHAQNIYHFGRDRAINFMEMRAPQTSGGPAIGRALFQEVEAAILERSSPHNLVHLSYMLHEAAERGGDFLLAAALLLHNTELNLARTILTKGKKTGTARAKMVGDILEICALLQRLRLYRYEHHAGQVHETVDSVIKLARGDWRVLLIYSVHQLSELATQTHQLDKGQKQAIEEIFASLCSRFGHKQLAKKLKDRALRLHDPELYERTEAKILEIIGMERIDAEIKLSELEKKLADHFRGSHWGLVSTFSRVKTAASALEKIAGKPDQYPDLESLKDYLAATVVTATPLGKQSAKEVMAALAGEFLSVDGKQTVPRKPIIDKKEYIVWHVQLLLNNGNQLEVQIMDQATARAHETNYRAHWAYDLKKTKKYAFDEELLSRIAPHLTLDFAHDAATVYQHLQPWDYVYVETAKGRRTIRCLHGSLPVDVYRLLRGQLASYGGASVKDLRTGKVTRAAEDKPLGDGAIVSFSEDGKAKLSHFLLPAYEATKKELKSRVALPGRKD